MLDGPGSGITGDFGANALAHVTTNAAAGGFSLVHGAAFSAPAPFTNTNVVGTDFFSTSNQFYGAQVGLRGEYDYGPFTIEAGVARRLAGRRPAGR